MVPTELLDVQKATVLDPTLVKMRAKVREAIALMADPYLSVCELRHEVSFSFFLSLSLAICLFLSLVLPQQNIMRFGCLSLSLWQVTKDTPAVAWFPADSSMGEAGSLGIK